MVWPVFLARESISSALFIVAICIVVRMVEIPSSLPTIRFSVNEGVLSEKRRLTNSSDDSKPFMHLTGVLRNFLSCCNVVL